MRYSFTTYPTFDRELKRLAKKYKSLKEDMLAFVQEIEQNPRAGTELGNNIYKYHLSIASKGKGKSGGGRIITMNILLTEDEKEIGLLYIYDKSERSNITDKEIKELIRKNGLI